MNDATNETTGGSEAEDATRKPGLLSTKLTVAIVTTIGTIIAAAVGALIAANALKNRPGSGATQSVTGQTGDIRQGDTTTNFHGKLDSGGGHVTFGDGNIINEDDSTERLRAQSQTARKAFSDIWKADLQESLTDSGHGALVSLIRARAEQALATQQAGDFVSSRDMFSELETSVSTINALSLPTRTTEVSRARDAALEANADSLAPLRIESADQLTTRALALLNADLSSDPSRAAAQAKEAVVLRIRATNLYAIAAREARATTLSPATITVAIAEPDASGSTVGIAAQRRAIRTLAEQRVASIAERSDSLDSTSIERALQRAAFEGFVDDAEPRLWLWSFALDSPRGK